VARRSRENATVSARNGRCSRSATVPSASVRGDLEIVSWSARGSRYSFGYPACPELDDRAKLVSLLKPERIGVELSEELQLHPEQSTDALIVHHPEAKYFNAR